MLIGILFFLVAFFYASVGFGGGSSYIALLVLWEVSYTSIPIIALVCNIIVVSGNSIRYLKAGYVNWRLLLPPTLFAMPMAFLGGRMAIDQELFVMLLFAVLLISGLRLLFNYKNYHESNITDYKTLSIWFGGVVGAGLGFLAGITGIGGGIFLAPLLYMLRTGSPKHISATASLFILLNSMAGLAGQLLKSPIPEILFNYWYLPLLVLLGGQLGNLLAVRWLPAQYVALLTGMLVLFVAGRLGLQILAF